jgi:hypothetical protein
VRGEGERGERNAVFFGDAAVHGKEIAGDDEIGLGHDRVHAGNHLGDVFFCTDVDLAELVDGCADFLQTSHPVAEVGLFPVGAKRVELHTGGLDLVLVMRNGGEADGMAGFLQCDGERDDGINVTGGAVGSEDDAHEIARQLGGRSARRRAAEGDVWVTERNRFLTTDFADGQGFSGILGLDTVDGARRVTCCGLFFPGSPAMDGMV